MPKSRKQVVGANVVELRPQPSPKRIPIGKTEAIRGLIRQISALLDTEENPLDAAMAERWGGQDEAAVERRLRAAVEKHGSLIAAVQAGAV